MFSTDPNILLMTDSYKVSHWKQYPPGTTRVFSYLESRGGAFPAVTFFGLQYIIEKYLAGRVVTQDKIDDAEFRFKQHFGSEGLFNLAGWQYILEKHNGCLPVRIKAVPEGTTVPTGNVLLTIENTDPAVPWLVNYLETLLVQVWYPTTVCTQSREMKSMLRDAMITSCDNLDGLPFKLHDFGYRGSTSVESAGIGGAAHLVNFKGTDTLAALLVADEFYEEPNAGFSIPAAEHSTITSWGRTHEVDAYRNMLTQYPTGLVAVVSDSYNVYDAVRKVWGEELRSEVLGRDGTVVIRPDSGDPPTVIIRLLRILEEKFGSTFNSKGYRVLDPHVRLIQGDGIDIDMLRRILYEMLGDRWSLDNIAFGSGGGLLQKLNRDTCKFAMKCSAIEINGQWLPVYKDPVGDWTKASKSGRLGLFDDGTGGFVTAPEDSGRNLLQTVFEDGYAPFTEFSVIRERAAL